MSNQLSNQKADVRGLLGRKVGMTQVWDENNRVVPVTVVEADTNVVTQIRKAEVDGYTAIQIGFGEIAGRKVRKPQAGHFDKAGVTPRRTLAEIRTSAIEDFEVGQEIRPDIFSAGDQVDITANTKGKGYAGVMKRHGFAGVGASHGQHRNHRKPGAIGGCATPARVFKGVRMAGRMGNERVTALRLTVHAVDVDKGLLLIKGSIPGPKGATVMIRSAAKKGAA